MRKAVVIGSGIGGAAVAALLAEKGFSVTVFEQSAFAGGKAASFERDGCVCDMGVHYSVMGPASPNMEVARRVGADLAYITKSPFLKLRVGNVGFDFPASFTNPVSLLKMAVISRARPWNALGAFRLFLKIMTATSVSDAEPLDETPLRDFLLSYTTDPGIYRLLDTFCALLFVIPADNASAGEFLLSFGGMARAKSPGYPKGGFQAIPKAFLKAMEKRGGSLRLSEPVEAIQVENSRALGVRTKNGFVEADVVVSDCGIKKTVELAGEEKFPREYVSRVKRLIDSEGCVSLRYGLDFLPANVPLYMYCPVSGDLSFRMARMKQGIVPNDPHLMMPMLTVSDPEMAPPGTHVMTAGSMVPARLESASVAETMLDRMEAKLEALFPGFGGHVLWKHRTGLAHIDAMGGRGAGEVIGLAQTVDQVGKNKPDAKTPVEGLWLVGCDAGGRGVGTDQAADSALNVSARIAGEHLHDRS